MQVYKTCKDIHLDSIICYELSPERTASEFEPFSLLHFSFSFYLHQLSSLFQASPLYAKHTIFFPLHSRYCLVCTSYKSPLSTRADTQLEHRFYPYTSSSDLSTHTSHFLSVTTIQGPAVLVPRVVLYIVKRVSFKWSYVRRSAWLLQWLWSSRHHTTTIAHSFRLDVSWDALTVATLMARLTQIDRRTLLHTPFMLSTQILPTTLTPVHPSDPSWSTTRACPRPHAYTPSPALTHSATRRSARTCTHAFWPSLAYTPTAAIGTSDTIRNLYTENQRQHNGHFLPYSLIYRPRTWISSAACNSPPRYKNALSHAITSTTTHLCVPVSLRRDRPGCSATALAHIQTLSTPCCHAKFPYLPSHVSGWWIRQRSLGHNHSTSLTIKYSSAANGEDCR